MLVIYGPVIVRVLGEVRQVVTEGSDVFWPGAEPGMTGYGRLGYVSMAVGYLLVLG